MIEIIKIDWSMMIAMVTIDTVGKVSFVIVLWYKVSIVRSYVLFIGARTILKSDLVRFEISPIPREYQLPGEFWIPPVVLVFIGRFDASREFRRLGTIWVLKARQIEKSSVSLSIIFFDARLIRYYVNMVWYFTQT